jgi:hypothetical protein
LKAEDAERGRDDGDGGGGRFENLPAGQAEDGLGVSRGPWLARSGARCEENDEKSVGRGRRVWEKEAHLFSLRAARRAERSMSPPAGFGFEEGGGGDLSFSLLPSLGTDDDIGGGGGWEVS